MRLRLSQRENNQSGGLAASPSTLNAGKVSKSVVCACSSPGGHLQVLNLDGLQPVCATLKHRLLPPPLRASHCGQPNYPVLHAWRKPIHKVCYVERFEGELI